MKADCSALCAPAIAGGIRALRYAYGGLRCRSGRCWTRATGTQHPALIPPCPSDVCVPLCASAPWYTAAVRGFHSKLSCRAARGTTTDESQMVPCRRHSTICRRYVYVPLRSALNACRRHAAPCFTFRLRRNSHSYRLVGKCPRIRTSELARMCVRLPSFHSKRTCRLAAASL